MKDRKLIAVLMGGWNSEREVSLRSGDAVYEALLRLGYRAEKVNFTNNVVDDLKRINPDVVFNALHGQYGEDGRVQGLLDILGIDYTHSGLVASAICMDKILTAKICRSYGIRMPKMGVLEKTSLRNQEIIDDIAKPFVIKPINDGSSIGVEVVLENDNFDISDYSWEFGDMVIIEKYIKGQEIQVAVMNNKALGAIEVRPKNLFYDYECKYTPGMTDYIMPAEISESKYKESLEIAQKVHGALGCEGISRIDMILGEKDAQFYLLEANTHPGFTELSLVPQIAKYAGITFEEIIEYLIASAKCGI